jgi:hypothetical protein
MLGVLDSAPRTALSLIFGNLTVLDIYQIGIGFILGSVTTVSLLLVLDIVRDVIAHKNNQSSDS